MCLLNKVNYMCRPFEWNDGAEPVCLPACLFIYVWLSWTFVAVHGLSLADASRSYLFLWFAGFSFQWLLLSQNAGSRSAGFSSCSSHGQTLEHVLTRAQVVATGLSGSVTRGIFPNQGLNLCPLHWQVNS